MTPEQAVKLCDRNFGVGADGVIFVLPGVNGTDYSMRIFNSDGSEPEVNSASFLVNLHVAQMSFLVVYLRKGVEMYSTINYYHLYCVREGSFLFRNNVF